MPSYCCFWCPQPGSEERSGDDSCASCGRPYNTPLVSPPDAIRDYRIERAISRGFYGATYRALQASLQRRVVLKVVPIKMYEVFKKDWVRECREHAATADGTEFVAQITDQFNEEVQFGTDSLQCHVAVLENIEGTTLDELITSASKHGLAPRDAAQIAADLFEILHLFTGLGRYHNDLHAGNIIVRRLSAQELRSNAFAPAVRAVAIDLGSVKQDGRSGEGYIGDQRYVARHLAALSRIINKGDAISDVDFRIAEAIRGLAEHLSAPPDSTRIMTVEDASIALQTAMRAADAPWRQPLRLRRFGGAYNAQALESWHVPELWFDPEGQWLKKTTAFGPQVITGMRGCGKTMLLRALHLHARAVSARNGAGLGSENVLRRLGEDSFVGVFASCQKLLNPQDSGDDRGQTVDRPFERLYVAYLRDALQILQHIKSIEPGAIVGGIAPALSPGLDALELPGVVPEHAGELEFDRYLTQLQFGLADGATECRLRDAPASAFGHLASVIRSAGPILADKYVLFLLDDVATRYLDQDMVREVISKLLFQHSYCAFRITTEAHALQRVLMSPGGSSPADPLRDYELFDLGSEVYRLLQKGSTKDRSNFVSEILRRRSRQFPDAPYGQDPASILGHVDLETIAREIGRTSRTSAERKSVYRGLRALQAACVGDLGDVVKLYERILERAGPGQTPVPADVQCECFLEHSALLVHYLNRRDQTGKKLALAFAQAAGELLQRSARGKSGRLRQYTKMYVRVDTGPDSESVANRLLDLLDAGVFVYDGGAPRTKTRDDDPVLQFKLSYRKMLGLASYIGLSDRDRFELSGDALRQWLEHPEDAKEILLQNQTRDALGVAESDEPEAVQDEGSRTTDLVTTAAPTQLKFNNMAEEPELEPISFAPSLGIEVVPRTLKDWARREIDTVVLGLGFEKRTVASAKRLLKVVTPRRVLLVRYTSDQGAEVEKLVLGKNLQSEEVDSPDALAAKLNVERGEAIVDTTGLSKSYLFVAVREALRASQRTGIVHTLAKDYYPKNDELKKLGITEDTLVSAEVLDQLTHLLMGETGPYRLVQVHREPGTPNRSRALLASASPKNDRLLHLLDERAYDVTRILAPLPNSPRRTVARAAAELATSAADVNTRIIDVDTNDMHEALRATEKEYATLYHEGGANVEVGLTGSKVHAVAFAALAAVARVSYAWYVAPKSYDRKRFTQGVGKTECFDILKQELSRG